MTFVIVGLPPPARLFSATVRWSDRNHLKEQRISAISKATALTVAALWLPAILSAQGTGSPAHNATDCPAMAAVADHANMDHAAIMAGCVPLPKLPGQAAYGSISEVVRMLEADSNTDWSRVNIEALRQHLIDMDDVVMHAAVKQHNVPSGMEAVVTGTGRTAGAITRMLASHTMMLDKSAEYHATTAPVPGGLRFTVTAKTPADSVTVARIRGLGFAGLLTEGDHHAAHHMALARGAASPHGQ